MKKYFTILYFFFCGSLSVAASSPLDFLYGRWQGQGVKGTIVRDSSECNYPKLGGVIGVIEARYVEVESQKIHLEFGILAPTPGVAPMQVKYTITVQGTHWFEIGELSNDAGLTWKKIYEMNMERIAETCQAF